MTFTSTPRVTLYVRRKKWLGDNVFLYPKINSSRSQLVIAFVSCELLTLNSGLE